VRVEPEITRGGQVEGDSVVLTAVPAHPNGSAIRPANHQRASRCRAASLPRLRRGSRHLDQCLLDLIQRRPVRTKVHIGRQLLQIVAFAFYFGDQRGDLLPCCLALARPGKEALCVLRR